ncbi:MAG: hypothetical protein ACWA5R_04710, partial [bacterium]
MKAPWLAMGLSVCLGLTACGQDDVADSANAVENNKPVTEATTDTNFPPVLMHLTKVSDHVYYVQGGAGAATDNHGFISNAAAIVTDDG